MRKKKFIFILLACLLALCVLPAVASAMKMDAVNTLRYNLLNCDTVITGKVQSVTIHEEEKSDGSVTNENYALINLKVQKTHVGEAEEKISVKYPIQYNESADIKKFSVKKNNTLLLFLSHTDADEDYSYFTAYKITSGKIKVLPSSYSEFDGKKAAIL